MPSSRKAKFDVDLISSELFGDSAANEVDFTPLSVTPDELSLIFDDQFGLSKSLRSAFPDLCTRGKTGNPNGLLKVLLALEYNDRRATPSELAQALSIQVSSVFQHVYKLKRALRIVFGIELLTGDVIRLPSQHDLEAVVEKLQAKAANATKEVERVLSYEKCLAASGVDTTALLGGVSGFVEAHKALAASSN